MDLGYEELEGKWRYIWLGYSRGKQAFTATLIEADRDPQTKSLTGVLHRPLDDFLSLRLGKDATGVSSFHGHIICLMMQLGPGAYITSPDEVKKIVLSSYALPVDLSEEGLESKKRENVDLIGDVQKLASTAGKDLSGTTWSGAEEYSIQGWFKINSSDGDKDCQVLFRVTDNEPHY